MGTMKDFWLGKPEPMQVRVDENGEPSAAILPPARASFINVQPREAMKIGTIYRSVSILSTTISQMELEVFRNGKKLKTPALIANPIDSESQASFVQQIVHSLALWGNAYVRVYGEPVSSVEVLDPDMVTVGRSEEGKVIYFVNGKLVNSKSIRHLKFERMPGADLGHGPLSGAAGELKAAVRLNEFMQTWFNVDTVPRGVIKMTEKLNAEQSKKLAEAWDAFINEHKNIVLPQGVSYEQLANKPMELQYQEVAEANVRNIARVFGIPAAALLTALEGTSMTYTNYVESNLQFMQQTLTRYMQEIEDMLSGLLPTNQKVQFNENQLFRMAPEKEWAIKKMMSDVGYYSGAEQREQEGLPALPQPKALDGPTTTQLPKDDDNEEL